MNRAPHPIEKCDQCRFYFGQIGDRDAQIRDLQKQVQSLQHHAAELELVRQRLAEVELPDHSQCGWPLTTSGQVAHLVRLAKYA